jgi:hypothetical protein
METAQTLAQDTLGLKWVLVSQAWSLDYNHTVDPSISVGYDIIEVKWKLPQSSEQLISLPIDLAIQARE